jgi:2-polyprenyl-3-methyl-5-hydroxy-6-metoxy-1,4-benzoquinol methylase
MPAGDTDFRNGLYRSYVSSFQGADLDRARWQAWYRHKLMPLLNGLPPQATILDLGCGPGQMLQLLQESGFTHAAGIDTSAEQIELATAYGLNAKRADAFEYLAGVPGRVDAIIAVDFIEHFEKPEQVKMCRAIHSALRPGGRLILQTPNGEGLFPGHCIYGDMTHLSVFNAGSLAQLLRVEGFEEIQFCETGPVAKNLKGAIRYALWRLVRMAANAVRLIETGRRQALWTENLICACRKPANPHVTGDERPGPDYS